MTQFSSFYSALSAAWNANGVTPANTTGTAMNTAGTVTSRLAAVNSWTMNNAQGQVLVPAWKVMNAIAPADYNSLSAANQTLLWQLLDTGVIDGSPNSPAAQILGSIFSGKTTTLNALVALQNSYLVPWWQTPQASGGGGLLWAPMNFDLVAAGLVSNPTMWTYNPTNKRRIGFNIAIDVQYTQVGADGVSATGTINADIGFQSVNLADSDVLVQALKRVVNVLLPGDAALAALTSN